MNGYLIDSSVFVAILRGKEEAGVLLASLEGRLTTSSVCIGELYEGIFRSIKKTENEKSFLNLLSTLDEIIPFGTKEAKLFGQLKVDLKRKPIPDLDAQIAATCLEHKMTLITYDTQHFDNITNLSIHIK